jgi:hypothetical protein
MWTYVISLYFSSTGKTTIFIFSMLIFQREIIKFFVLPEAEFDASFCPDIVN